MLLDALYPVVKNDITRAGIILKDAFEHDPLWTTLFASIEDAEEKTPFFFQMPVMHSLRYGSVYATSPKMEGIAAWANGKQADMTMYRVLRSGAFKVGMKMGSELGRKLKPIFTPMERDRKIHMRGREHVYLQIIGVAQEYQHQGFGGRILRALIEDCESKNLAIYLETETLENVAMYEKFGFGLIRKITLPVVDHPMWEMVRDEPGV